ncbi:ThiF family adenylyltransferase [Devosia sediminis]|uniref:ThiF family adenylyltransferase n=1 Tax=Devosia sediminis TaxID=2798801 RepID=A0A934MIN6_9HYPH|nr:ThiF family adenylyltransferase [Devosia sediminis]MBJ3786407.1 ThiF family adenylyltransferase [Devosia sediminis]
MSRRDTLVLSGSAHQALKAHLICGDGNEAAAILLCKATAGDKRRLLVREVILVPHDACPLRMPDRVVWPGDFIEQAIDRAERDALLVILIHSHPGGWLQFSEVDDQSDRSTMPALFAAFGQEHGSAIMTPDGAIRARFYRPDMSVRPVDLTTVAGDDINYWWNDAIEDAELAPWPLPFTTGMRKELGRLSIAVIGVSGTGSLVAEQLARMGARVTLVDFDHIERKNLNRIIYATLADAEANRLKVEMFAEAVASYRGPGVAVPIAKTVASRDAVLAVAQCDVIFSCVDTQEARQIADLIAAAFLIPLFDVGVVIPTRKAIDGMAIADVCGRIDYVQPGGATLSDRGVYTPEGLRAEYLRRVDPEAFRQELEAGYIKGLMEQAPSVISLNMRASSAVVMEFIARAFRFRHDSNRGFARTEFSLAAAEEEYRNEDDFEHVPDAALARGDEEPLLGLPALGPGRDQP